MYSVIRLQLGKNEWTRGYIYTPYLSNGQSIKFKWFRIFLPRFDRINVCFQGGHFSYFPFLLFPECGLRYSQAEDFELWWNWTVTIRAGISWTGFLYSVYFGEPNLNNLVHITHKNIFFSFLKSSGLWIDTFNLTKWSTPLP